jgi:hypothetical protein
MNIIGGKSSRYQLAGTSIGSVSLLQRLHPIFRPLRVIDLGPAVAGARVIGLEVVVHQAVVVFDAALAPANW